MYENLIKRTPISSNPNNFSVRLIPMPVSKKVAYVESVCASLIDSRFGRQMTPFIINFSELPDDEAMFCEMTDEGIVPSYVILPDSEMARLYAADIVRPELAQAEAANVSVRAQTHPPSNLGRGSPQTSLGRTHVSVART